MPKRSVGLELLFQGEISIGLEMEVLVIKEQNADGMVTVSARALIFKKELGKYLSGS